MQEYKNVQRWTDAIAERPAVKRGRMVNRAFGEPPSQLHERHDASDFETKTQDKLAAVKMSWRRVDSELGTPRSWTPALRDRLGLPHVSLAAELAEPLWIEHLVLCDVFHRPAGESPSPLLALILIERCTTRGMSDATTRLPCPRISATGLSPNTLASIAPC